MITMSARKLWLTLGWLGVCLVIFGSLYPLPMPAISPSSDKLHHLLAYGGLFWWFSQALTGHARWKALIALILMGIAIEFLQPYSNRFFEVKDMMANVSGILIAWILTHFGVNLPYRLRNRIQST